jgi:chorismate dehydratase
MIRVGHFPSAPWAPYYAGDADWASVRLVDCVSSEVKGLMEAGLLDATPMATVDWLDMLDSCKRIAGYGLAYRERAGSVLLFSDRPIEALDGAPLAISTETTTSVRVLRAILAGKYRLALGPLQPMTADTPPTTPRLLIQDEAVEERARKRFAYVYDLGEEWWSWQRSPIVSAVWVARAGLPDDEVARIAAVLDTALTWSAAHPSDMARRFLANRPALMSADALGSLLGNFCFRLGADEERGIDIMKRTLESRASIQKAYDGDKHVRIDL